MLISIKGIENDRGKDRLEDRANAGKSIATAHLSG